MNDEMKSIAVGLLRQLDQMALPERIEAMNELRQMLHEQGPFAGEPVDFVRWVPARTVTANTYNPNIVAPPEMELLRLSIEADGYTQPIVVAEEDGSNVIVDGFHRHRVGKECASVGDRVNGYLPVVAINLGRTGEADRVAATIRHNRARGRHGVQAMGECVLALARKGWNDKKISVELGMDADEVLRLRQVTGMAEAFANREFSEAWEWVREEEP